MDGVSVKKKLLGGEVEFTVFNAEKTFAEPVLEDVYTEALRLQKIFNFYDKDSELSKLNEKRELNISEELLHVLKNALKLCSATNGKYDISLGKKIIARKHGENVYISCSYKDISVKNKKVILNNKDVMIDLGSIAKGYIADRLTEYLREKGVDDVFIDARGDIIASGNHEHILEIQHPRDKEKTIGKVKIKNEGVATSGDYLQYHENYEKSHILNQNAISVTVIAKTLEEADVFATALFVTDKKTRKELMNNNPEIKALIVDNEMKQTTYNGFEAL